MQKWMRALWMLLYMTFAGVALSGCKEDGPAEEIGEEIDEAAEDVKDAVD